MGAVGRVGVKAVGDAQPSCQLDRLGHVGIGDMVVCACVCVGGVCVFDSLVCATRESRSTAEKGVEGERQYSNK